MARQILHQQHFNGGISVSEKEGLPAPDGKSNASFVMAKNIDIHQDPTRFTLTPALKKVSGSVVTGLIKWIVSGVPYTTFIFAYDTNGVLYQQDGSGVWTVLRTVTNSHGQGLEVYSDYLYYVQDTQVGRYGPLDGTPSFTDNWQTGLTNTATTGFAPAYAAGGSGGILVIGHGNNVATYNVGVWTLARLTVLAGENIRSFSYLQNYVVIGTWRSNSGNIYDSEEGHLYFWDTSSLVFNFVVTIPEGSCNVICNTRNTLLGILGSQGYLYKDLYTYINQFGKMQPFPLLKPANFVEVYPGAMSNWRGKTYYASSNSDSSDITRGIYEWGGININYPDVLNMSYTISTGNTGTGVNITAIEGLGASMYVAWQDQTSGTTLYGVDKVTNNGPFNTTGNIQTLIFDATGTDQDCFAITLKATHFPLKSGESIQIGYKINRSSSWTLGTLNSTVGSIETRLNMPPGDARFREIQQMIVLGSSGSTSPTVTSSGLEYDDLREEANY